MLKLKTKQYSIPVTIIRSNITFIMNKAGGCVIYFVGGESLHVEESYDEVVSQL